MVKNRLIIIINYKVELVITLVFGSPSEDTFSSREHIYSLNHRKKRMTAVSRALPFSIWNNERHFTVEEETDTAGQPVSQTQVQHY